MSPRSGLLLALALLTSRSSAALPEGEAAGGGTAAAPSPPLGSLRGAAAAAETEASTFAAAARQAGCEDTSPHCAAWASTGECQHNPNYMLVACKASCAVEGCGATPAPTPAPTSPPTEAPTTPLPVPGLEDCLQKGFTIDKCYQREGFVDGDCKCVPGLWEGRYTWYQWICTTKGGLPHKVQYCSQDCSGGCGP